MSTRKLTEISVRSSVKLTGDINETIKAINTQKYAATIAETNPKSLAKRHAEYDRVFHTEMCRLMNTQDNGEGEG